MSEPETLSAPCAASADADDIHARALLPLAILSGAAFVGLTVAVCLFALFGQTFAERMSTQVGDIEAARARSLYEAGLVENAIAAYRKALEMKFDDPNQRRWAMRRFGEMLLNEKRAEDAVPVLKACLAAFPDDLPAHELYCRALEQTGHAGDLVDAARAMSAAAADNRGSQSTAKFYLGCAWERLAKPDAALQAWTEGQSLDPKGRCAYRAASLLNARGDRKDALDMLSGIPADMTGGEADAARALRGEIEAALQETGAKPAQQAPAGG